MSNEIKDSGDRGEGGEKEEQNLMGKNQASMKDERCRNEQKKQGQE